jgi:energy-coupling factor transporter ATP-binding protein EcfA2
MSAIAVEGLAKRFGEVEAVANVSCDVREGELFGFLGPNGAGKTTTINMLTGLARPDASKQIRPAAEGWKSESDRRLSQRQDAFAHSCRADASWVAIVTRRSNRGWLCASALARAFVAPHQSHSRPVLLAKTQKNRLLSPHPGICQRRSCLRATATVPRFARNLPLLSLMHSGGHRGPSKTALPWLRIDSTASTRA